MPWFRSSSVRGAVRATLGDGAPLPPPGTCACCGLQGAEESESESEEEKEEEASVKTNASDPRPTEDQIDAALFVIHGPRLTRAHLH